MNHRAAYHHLNLAMITLIVTALSASCADLSQVESNRQDKSYDDWEAEWESMWTDSDDDEDTWAYNQTSDGTARSDGSSDDYYGGSDAHQNTSSEYVNLGDICAPGCIWSAQAVSSGAQSADMQCGDQYCACVPQGNIWSTCTPNSGSSSQQSQQNQQSQQSDDSHSSSYSGYDAHIGGQIADAAYRIAIQRNTTGWCYTAAADAIESVMGRFLYGASAYMAADQLYGHSRFTEISAADLRGLPAGAVVVWSRGSSDHGHISIALGDGREASDHVATQMTSHYGGGPARVFLPR